MKPVTAAVLFVCVLLSACSAGQALPSATVSSPAPAEQATSATAEKTTAPSALPSPSRTAEPADELDSSPAVELIAKSALPAPEAGDWYEWDKAGNYPANNNCINGSLYYIEGANLLLRTDSYFNGNLIISNLDGTGAKALDEDIQMTLNFYKSFIYYMKPDGIWRIKPDGSEKKKIISRKIDEQHDNFFIYADRLYYYRQYKANLESFNLKGQDHKIIKLSEIPIGSYFCEDGFLYMEADTAKNIESGGDSWDILRYNIDNGESTVLAHSIYGTLLVRNKMAYYYLSDMERTDGKIKEAVINSRKVYWDENYILYSNYLLFFKNGRSYGGRVGGNLCAIDVDSLKEYELFEMPELESYQIYAMENSVFLYSGYEGDPVYQITFEGGKAKLWRLNGLDN